MAIDRAAALKRAEKLLRQGKLDGAIEEYVRLVDDQPRDVGSINALGDLYLRAGDPVRAAAQFIRVADFFFEEGFLSKAAALYKKTLKIQDNDDHLLSRLAEIATQQELFSDAKAYLRQLARKRRADSDARGAAECLVKIGSLDQSPEALDALVDAAQMVPEDVELRARVVRECLAAGQMERARPFLTAESAGDEPDLLLAVAVSELSAGRDEQARSLLTRLITVAPARDADVLRVAEDLAQEGGLERAYGYVDIVADAALMQGDVPRAAAALQAFLRHGAHVPALIKLVDLCVDAGLDQPMRQAQEMLADAYLDMGRAVEARVISEDLLAWDPASTAHRGRLTRALEMLGVDDIAGTLAALTSGDSMAGFDQIEQASDPPPVSSAVPTPAPPPAPTEEAHEPIDMESTWLADARETESLELDLNEALAELSGTVPAPIPDQPVEPPDLEEVFGQIRADVDRHASDASTQYNEALREMAEGRLERAIAGLEAVSRDPVFRFKAAGQLGRIYLDGGDPGRATEWLERAAEATPPTPDAGFNVLCDLAAALEASGEPARALAILMELDTAAGGYRDIREHIERLSRVQTGGEGA